MKTSLSLLAFSIFLGTAVAASAKPIIVAVDGSGDFKTVQEALAAAPENSQERTVIHLKAGTYEGPFVVPKSKPNVTLEGEGAEKTILNWPHDVKDPIPPDADKFNPGLHVQGDGFQADGVTIQNTAGDKAQALALRIDGDRAALKNCRILGWQDTLMVNNGRQYFKDCHIEGRVDFIYGSGTAAFEDCEIKSKNGGYVTAASTPQEKPFGFVFLRCKLIGDPAPWNDPTGAVTPKPTPTGPATYLGRPWRPFASVAFIHCEMGDHIKPEGWHNWNKPENEKTARNVEFENSGPGAASDKRASWARQLTKEEADKITAESVLAGTDGWKPQG